MMHRRPLVFFCGLGAFALGASTLESPAAAEPTVTPRMFVDEMVPIPASVMTTLGTLLPESVPVGSSLISESYNPNLKVKQSATVKVTYVREGAGYANALGYFTYAIEENKVIIKTRQLIFPWVKDTSVGGQLARGDTVTLRDKNGAVAVFEEGTRIGFFVVANGWTGNAVSGWNPTTPALPSSSPSTNAKTASGVITTLDELNPEISVGRADVARHYLPLSFPGTPGFLGGAAFHLVGIEDLRRDRGSDNDFNDVLFMVQSTPPTAVEVEKAVKVVVNPLDPDGDGVQGLADAYPNDAERATELRSPPTGYQGISFEDTYPFVGDMDYNDAFFEYAYNEVLRADGRIKELMGTYHLIARGAGFDHRFGVAIHGVPASVSGTLSLQCFSSAGVQSDAPTRSLHDLIHLDVDGSTTLRIQLFDDTKAALPTTNTSTVDLSASPASCRFLAVFDTPLVASLLGTVPFDPYLEIERDDGFHDVHLPGQHPFAGRPAGLPKESGVSSFIDTHGYPWALLVPADFRFPLEGKRIDSTDLGAAPYPQFTAWRASRGAVSKTWYQAPTVSISSPRVSAGAPSAVLARGWSVAFAPAAP